MRRSGNFKLSLVIPAFNEAENLPVLLHRIAGAVSSISDFEVVIVDDGSSDGSCAVLRRCRDLHPQLRYIALSRNYGHQIALRAGMEAADGDCVICLDADLQHPPELIHRMVGAWQAGADIVSCIRQEQTTLPFFKRMTSKGFYRSLSWLSGMKLAPGSSDFRLLDRKVAAVLNDMPEADLFYRGIIPTLGFKSVEISYVPNERLCGKSKYTLRKMVKLALVGIISTSTRPLRLATYFALLTATGAIFFLIHVLYIFFVARTGVPGWASTLATLLTLGTMQLLVLGLIGEYLGQVLRETRRRPPYLVDEASSATDLAAGEGRVRRFRAA